MTGTWRLQSAVAVAGMVLTAACSSSAVAEPVQAPITYVTNPVEILFDYATVKGLSSGDEHVLTQCDNHGHRVFISRHPEEFRVLADPSCPGAPERQP